MPKRVLILGGYGNFGGLIARRLAPETDLQLIVAGRSLESARRFGADFQARNPVEAARVEVCPDVAPKLAALAPDIVIHTCGPFQQQGYGVAEACIGLGCHYVDLADGRAFVAGIHALDEAARAAGVLAISGASTVPTLSAAIIDTYRPEFQRLRKVAYGITAAQRARPGPATTRGILSYVGRPFESVRDGKKVILHGWQRLHSVRYPRLKRRWFGNCDIPDLALFPGRYPEVEEFRFAAGHEVGVLHKAAWAASWLVRWHLLPPLDRFSSAIHRAMGWFDFAGSDSGGLHMILSGTGLDGRSLEVRYWLEATSGHGPLVPCVPAILLARRIARGEIQDRGARPCLDLVDLPAYLRELEGLDVAVSVERVSA